ncbi:hypothetical protein H0E87_008198 [Populus deltoides]|uniref:Uncharacterized protein n=1 Tax=Populus deltoides TaxID=3696 RepID=A0A8T2YZW2_POPDE|nr:hypothetical protein H0E87_008198 [Populus deltoides]
MVRDCPAWVVQPKCLLLFVALLIFLIFAFTSPKQDEVKEEEQEYEITHRVYLDIDIDEQRQGRIVIGLYGKAVSKTAGMFLIYCACERQSTFILQNQNSRDNQHFHDELFEVYYIYNLDG